MPSAQQAPSVELSTLVTHLSTEQIQAIKSGSPVVIDPNRNSKGQFVPGNTASVNNSGRPCSLCEKKEHYMSIVNAYIAKCRKAGEGKIPMPFKEELALDLDVNEDTIADWCNKKNENGEREHPEFFRAIDLIETLQKLRLKQRLLGRYNPTGAIKLLEWNHGMVTASKQILAGDKTEPLEIVITKAEEVRHDAET